MRLKLRYKLLGFSIALAVIPLAVASRTMIRITQDELQSSANDAISVTAQEVVKGIDELYRDSWLAPLLLVASGIDSETLEPPAKVALLNAGITNIADVVACQLSVEGMGPALIIRDTARQRLAGKGLDPAEVLRVAPEEIAELLARRPGQAAAGEPVFSEVYDGWLVTIAIPLSNPIAGRAATFAARLDSGRLRDVVEQNPFTKTGSISLVDASGREVFDPARRDHSELAIVADARERLASGARAIQIRPYVRPTGERMLAAFGIPQSFDWAVIVELNEHDAYTAVRKMLGSVRTWVIVGLAVALVGGLVFARSIARPVENVARVAQEVGKGNLEVEVERVRSGDEIGQLALRMNEMIRGLRERDFIRDTFGRYVSPEVAKKVLTDPSALHPGGELRKVTIMFSDLRGFTSLSEQLSPAEMVAVLNAYLGRMADIVAKHDGTVIEFIGDAIMALFGAPTAHPDAPLHAVACAAEMQVELERFNGEYSSRGVPPLQQGVGISTGSVIVGNIGSEKRMKYGVVGDDVNLAARAESFTVGGEILVAEATYLAIGSAAQFRGPIEVKAKGKKEPLRLYAVVAVGAPYDLRVPAEHRPTGAVTEVHLAARCYRVVGNVVGQSSLEATVVGLSSDEALLDLGEGLKEFENLKLRIQPAEPGAPPLDDLYAKVLEVEEMGERHRCRVRFTSVPEAERDRLKRLAGEG